MLRTLPAIALSLFLALGATAALANDEASQTQTNDQSSCMMGCFNQQNQQGEDNTNQQNQQARDNTNTQSVVDNGIRYVSSLVW
jgi:hypothetical protein